MTNTDLGNRYPEGGVQQDARSILHLSPDRYGDVLNKAERVRRSVTVEPTDPADKALVEHLRKKFSGTDSLKAISDLFEATMMDSIHRLQLFGANVEVRYSPYDDYKNGVDVVIVIKNKEGQRLLALAVDLTFGEKDIHDKLARIKCEVISDTLTPVKYSGLGNLPSEGVPRCVIALNILTVSQLIRLWLDDTPVTHQAIRAHPVIDMILQQIRAQLLVFESVASNEGNFGSEADFADVRRHFEGCIQLRGSRKIPEDADLTHNALMFKLRHFSDIKPFKKAA